MQNHSAMRWPFRKKASSNKEEARRFYNAKAYEKAEPFLNAMLKENPNDAWAIDVLSRLYMNTSRHEETILLMQRIISSKPKPEFLRRIVHAGCVAKDMETVMRFALRIKWTPADDELLSKIHEAFWPLEQCRAFFLQSTWKHDMLFPIFVQAGDRFESGDLEGAIELLTSLMSSEVVNESSLMFARQVCESLGQVDMAHDLWVNYLRHIEGELSKKRSLAKRLKHARRYEDALQIAIMVLEEDPNDVQMLTIVTEIAHRTSQTELALDAYHRLNRNNEAKLFHLRRFAHAAIKSSSIEDMVFAVERLVKHDADANATIRNSYLKLCELNAYEQAEQILEIIQDSVLRADLEAARLLEEGDPELALSLLVKGLENHPDYISFHMRKGIALEALGRLDEAIAAFETVLQLNPNHESASHRRLKCGVKMWSEDEFFEQITIATKAFPNNLNHQFARLNYVLSVKKDFALALEIVEMCLKYHPNHERSLLYLALVHSWMGNHNDARKAIRKCLIRWPASNDVHITASQIEKNAENPTEQIGHINAMLAVHGLKPVKSTSPTLAITPQYLSTEIEQDVQDERLVSIVMTAYKRDPLLDTAIGSILNQTYRNIELLIIDDCSPDDNFAYLQQLAEADKRIRVFRMEENGGTYVAKNFGMTQAKGAFIGFMDSDDYCHAQRIEFQVASLDKHPDVMGITHDYFRIDESSDIEFRGIGALRMACISLLMRREVMDEIGFFDSLRVGADTEYIERIEAHYGTNRRLRLRVPSMFMMLHSSSLTGGGPFHISWRSVTGPRLQHHASFRNWHRKIKAGLAGPFVPRKIHLRPFEVPEEMKSIHHEWKEGMPLFSEMIKKRNYDWWKGKKSLWQKKLSPKLAGRDFVQKLGLKVPELYWKGNNLEEIPDFDKLPKSFVLKPEKGWSSNNVYCMKEGNEILTHRSYSRDEICTSLAKDEFITTSKPAIMIEELLEPEKKQELDGLPRDFKFYCFGEQIAMIHVVLRKSEINKDENEHQYYTPEFNLIQTQIMEKRKQGKIPIERPDCWEEMIQSVKTIGMELGIYMRIDMFATNRGAVFGEFTPTPHGGNGYSDFANKYLGTFWKGEEGVK
jgi:glycosyltransferase involved in cell wall biosynthesis